MIARTISTGLGIFIVGAILLIALSADFLAPHDPFAQDLMQRMIPPSWMDGGSRAHLLGKIGRASCRERV